MKSTITQHMRELVQTVHDNPKLGKIIDEDPKAEMNPLIRNHLQNASFMVGYDFLKLNLRSAKMLEGKNYDLAKIRRRLEEYLRKYATDQDIIKMALFYDVSLK